MSEQKVNESVSGNGLCGALTTQMRKGIDMAEILINRVALPPKGEHLMISVLSNGSVAYKLWSETAEHRTTAQELPPHGDLIDRDKFLEKAKELSLRVTMTDKEGNVIAVKVIPYIELFSDLKNEPVVIEANKNDPAKKTS